LRDKPGTTGVLLIAAPALHFVAGFLQVSVIGLVSVTLGYFALRANRPFRGGLGFGLLAYKPPLAFGVGVILACASVIPAASSSRRIAAGAIVAALGQLAIGTLYW